jgi:CO/xanthine dehydrogenase FAD-binding subunit
VKGDLRSLEVVRPRKLAEALALLSEPDAPMPLAGGTDLFVFLNDGKQPARRYLDLTRLAELRGIEAGSAALRLGARTTYTDLRRSRDVARLAPVVAEMAATVGAAAIQNRGTVGGSLGNASPASDPAPVLLALDARVELARLDGGRIERRTTPCSSFFVGYRKTAAEPGELITAIEIPAASLDGWRYAYRKVGTRRAQAISKVVAAVGVAAGEARVAFGSVAPTTVRASAAEAALAGRTLDERTVANAAEALVATDLRPIDDLRSTAAYRALVAGRMLRSLLADLGGFEARLD